MLQFKMWNQSRKQKLLIITLLCVTLHNIPKLVGYWIKTPKALLAGYTIAKIALYILGFSILLTDTSKKVFTGQWSIIALACVYSITLSVSFLPWTQIRAEVRQQMTLMRSEATPGTSGSGPDVNENLLSRVRDLESEVVLEILCLVPRPRAIYATGQIASEQNKRKYVLKFWS